MEKIGSQTKSITALPYVAWIYANVFFSNYKRHVSCEIEDIVETHVSTLRVMYRLRMPLLFLTFFAPLPPLPPPLQAEGARGHPRVVPRTGPHGESAPGDAPQEPLGAAAHGAQPVVAGAKSVSHRSEILIYHVYVLILRYVLLFVILMFRHFDIFVF